MTNSDRAFAALCQVAEDWYREHPNAPAKVRESQAMVFASLAFAFWPETKEGERFIPRMTKIVAAIYIVDLVKEAAHAGK